ncbi:hypothetical protein GGX14DRAFT_578439 [Mycena pura]|uniref:Uncharacterized protein n=1 Tax=Mycena pura TaxID=153505 RepID=A0AAD6UWX7_9AGAR|nr:hypothetical protein GGX14DRAFT_578439 [Mycena pura]
MEPSRLTVPRFGFFISPLTPPHVPDVLLCSVDTRFEIVNLVSGLNSDVTPVSARNLSRWLFLLARHAANVRPIRPPTVYRPITVVGTDLFIRQLAETDARTFPCDSPDELPPGCYALFDSQGRPFPYPVGETIRRHTFAETERSWDVPDDHGDAVYRLSKPVIQKDLVDKARQRDRGLCCFTGRPSDCIAWVIPPLLSRAVTPPTFPRVRCISADNVFTISPDLLEAYYDNRIAVDPQDEYRIVTFEKFSDVALLDRLAFRPCSGRFWHSSLCWTLGVRIASCDARFDGVSTGQAEELLDELNYMNHMIPQSPRWSTPAGQEAIRAFFWARTGALAAPQEWEEPEHNLSLSLPSSDEVAPIVPVSREVQVTEKLWLISYGWWIFFKCPLPLIWENNQVTQQSKTLLLAVVRSVKLDTSRGTAGIPYFKDGPSGTDPIHIINVDEISCLVARVPDHGAGSRRWALGERHDAVGAADNENE